MGNSSSDDSDSESEQSEYTPEKVFSPSTFIPSDSGNWYLAGLGYTRRSNYLQNVNYMKFAKMRDPPNVRELYFDCPNCKAKLYDGGLNKKLSCECGKFYKRIEDGVIVEIQGESNHDFRDLFNEINNQPSGNYIPDLISITLGLFREDAPSEFMTGGRANFPTIFNYYLVPFFKKQLRCLGIGDYFAHGEAKFKVLGAFPSFGIITENTVIICSEILTQNPINRIQLLPVINSVINAEIFDKSISKALKNKHLFTGEYIFIDGNEYIVTTAQPNDGVVDVVTQFYFEGDEIEVIQTVSLIPYMEDLSFYYQALARHQLIEEIMCDFVMP